MPKKTISTRGRNVNHPFANQNTQPSLLYCSYVLLNYCHSNAIIWQHAFTQTGPVKGKTDLLFRTKFRETMMQVFITPAVPFVTV